MKTSRTIVTVLAAVLGVSGARLVAQSGAASPTWEVLARVPLPGDAEPAISVNGLTMPAEPVAEHSHAGPVIAYIVDGEIENQVEGQPPATFKPGGFFSEAPRQLHKMMRNLSAEPAKLLIFKAGRTRVPASSLKPLTAEPAKLSFAPPTQWQVPLPSTANQELRLIRLTLAPGTRTEAAAHSGPGFIYVLEGTVTILGASAQAQNYTAGDLFLDPANRPGLIYRNMSGSAPAKLLLYHASDPKAPAQTSPMMPYVAVHDPVFAPAREAAFLLDDDYVIGVAHGKTAKAYPALDLTQHGSVDDEMPDGPIEVTWCSACGTGAVFRAELKGRRGEAISGPLTGSTLTLYPFVLTTWKAWRTRYPSTTVLIPQAGYAERMAALRPRMKQARMSGEGVAPAGSFGTDTRLRPREMIAGLAVGNETMAFPLSALRNVRVANESVGGVPVVVVHQPSSDTTTAFEAGAKGKVLRFESAADASTLIDRETHSTWDAYGLCLKGPLKGTQLKPLILVPEFWFAWSQFRPGTRVFTK